jgi:hypothetical protein
MLERAVSDTERGDTEPGTAVVFMPAADRHDGSHFFSVTRYVFILREEELAWSHLQNKANAASARNKLHVISDMCSPRWRHRGEHGKRIVSDDY